MSTEGSPTLRGYDSYVVSLGDEMRGVRASLGKSLLDVQRDLRIKASYIDAIENARPQDIPYPGFVAAYVRSYARFLGMDQDEVMRRLVAESGFRHGPADPTAPQAGRPARSTVAKPDLDAMIAGSRLAAASRAEAMSATFGSTLRAAASVGVLATLVAGLGYGGWAMLENIQRVRFAPSPEGPEALAELPAFETMTRIARAGVAPAPAIDARALAAIYAAQEAAPPQVEPRDGPIAALDPARVGVYADRARLAAPAEPEPPIGSPYEPERAGVATAVDAADGSIERAAVAGAAEGRTGGPSSDAPDRPEIAEAVSPAEPDARGVALVFEGEAWIRVRDGAGVVAREALVPAGEVWRLPEDASGYTLRAGNAGGVLIEVDGVRYGPIGDLGEVVNGVALDAEAVRSAFPIIEEPPQLAAGPASP